MYDIKVGSIVQIRDLSGFTERTANRFKGRCCKVESLECSGDGYLARVRIFGCKDEPFNSLTVRVSRLVYIHQLPKGTQPKTHAEYVMKSGDVFRMTEVRDEDAAGSLLLLLPGQRFRIRNTDNKWVLDYMDAHQDVRHYTDSRGSWINGLLNAGVIERVKVKAPEFGPVPVDDWSYNLTTLEGLARGEVAELRSTISDDTTRLCGFTHIRKAGIGCWVRINPEIAHYVAGYLSARGVFANPINLGWVFLRYDERAFKDAAVFTNGNVVYITAFEYPAMRPDLEASFSSGISCQ